MDTRDWMRPERPHELLAFMRIRIDEGGGLEAWVIGKDNPLGPGPPILIDQLAWPDPGTGR